MADKLKVLYRGPLNSYSGNCLGYLSKLSAACCAESVMRRREVMPDATASSRAYTVEQLQRLLTVVTGWASAARCCGGARTCTWSRHSCRHRFPRTWRTC